MNTEVFYGDFGTGKTFALFEKIKALAEKGEKCLLFVPEQFSFDTERAVYFRIGARNLQYVKVTGFSKLSREILKEFKAARPVADSAVKLITMWKTVENAKSELLCYKNSLNSPGFCRLMLKTVAAFRNGGITPEDYRRLLAEEQGLSDDLAEKAEDFLRIYTDYDRMLTENLDDKLDDVSRAAVLAEERGYFKEYHLFFDNFDSFSAVQKKLLNAAMAQCRSSAFCLSLDSPQRDEPAFLCVKKTLSELREIDGDLTERAFNTPYRKEKREKDAVEIFSASTPYEEARLATAKIHHLVREENYRYRDILILTADNLYQPIIANSFQKSNIPFFCDFPRPMTEKPAVGFVLQVLKALDFETEEILALAESGFKRIERNSEGNTSEKRLLQNRDSYRLRNGAEAYGITKEDWEKDWSGDPRKELNPLENMRRGIITPLKELKSSLENAADGAEMTFLFMNYLLEEEGLKSTFIARSKTGEGEGTDYIEVDEAQAEEHLRIWDALCEAMTSMAYCLKGRKISCEQYRLLLEEILSGVDLANPPQVLDCVTVGDIERTRKASPKAVFIMGANEGSIPRESHAQSAFSYSEIEALNKAGIAVYDSNLNRWSKERYFAKRGLELYEKRLIITYCRRSTTGTEKEPAEFLKAMNTAVLAAEALPLQYFLNTNEDIKAALAESCGKKPDLADKLSQLLNDDDFGLRLENNLNYLRGGRRFGLAAETAGRLLGRDRYSPTALTAAFQCPFMYFCRYGLELSPKEPNDIASPVNVGNAVHGIMSKAMSLGIKGKTDEELREIAETSVEAELQKAIESDPTHPDRFKEVFRRISYRIYPLLKQTRDDMEKSGYIPSEFEKKVSYVIEDSEDSELKKEIEIYGVADRIDILPHEGKNYIRILDYKTGESQKKFSTEGVECGADLQMLLYLFAECGENNLPAQVGYFNAGENSKTEVDRLRPLTDAEAAKAWYDKHIISGAVFGGEIPLAAVENSEKSIKAETKSPRKSFNIMTQLSAEKFGALKDYVNNGIILPKIRSLYNGGIDAVPLEKDDRLPCGFCRYQLICGSKGDRVAAPGKKLEGFLD